MAQIRKLLENTIHDQNLFVDRPNCTTGEFSFIVSIATAFWITLLLPFTGWRTFILFFVSAFYNPINSPK